MILSGRDGASGRRRRWVILTLVISIIALIGGLVLVLLLSQFYIVPHLESDDFVQTQCYVRSIEIVHINQAGQITGVNSPNCSKTAGDSSTSIFDFSLESTTKMSPGLYPTRSSHIFNRKYDHKYLTNRRSFPERPRPKISPPNPYDYDDFTRLRNWDPFEPKTRHRRMAAPAPAPGVIAPVPLPLPKNLQKATQPTPVPQRKSGCSSGGIQEGVLCVHVSVLYRGIDGFVALGTLYSDRNSLLKNNQSTITWSKKCICDGCEISAISMNGSAVDALVVAGTKLQTASRTRCYYPMNGGNHLLMWRKSNAVALHSILWPTLVFVSGFVGLFFSCLILQKQRQQQRKQQARPPLAYV